MPEVREYGSFNTGRKNGHISPRNRRQMLRWPVIGLIISSFLGGYLSYWKFSTALKAQKLVTFPVAGADNVHVLKLVQLHHYGGSTESESGEHLILNVDQRIKKLAGEHFKSSNVNVEEVWTSEARFATTNPFDYPFALRATEMEVTRLVERDPDTIDSYISYSYEDPEMAAKNGLEWTDEVVSVPDVTDKNTVMAVALMSSNAYVELPYTGDWRNLTDWTMSGNKSTSRYGWDSDGIRAHVFATEDGSTVVFAIKGTSSQVLPGSGDDATSANDKLNDNLLFSCCCARVGYLWTTVCDCYSKSYTCDESCLERELRRHDRYYYAVVQMYKTVVKSYPNATIWLTGHSLGGSLASLLGRTYGVPAITFEAPGELLPAKRLHLPFPPGFPTAKEAIWHFGNTADPIYMGTCNGASSTCSIAGYAMETKCHSGKRCIYDVVADLGWRVNILNHRIHTVIDKVINEYENPPKCEYPDLCQDCYNWNFFRTNDPYHDPPDEDNENTSPTTIPTATTSLDPPTKTTTAPDTTTSKCVGRNWFGLCTEYSYYGCSPTGYSPTHTFQAN